ncbi:hypothetical protein CsSME_00032592 [Camellia sinensis var. sinensis]
MDKGWGLTLDSDSIGFFPNKPAGLSLTPRLNRSRGGMFSGIEFPVRLNRKEEQHTALQPSDENRTVVNEVDFFCDKKKSTKEDDYMDSKASISRVKKENSHETGPGMDLDVNVSKPFSIILIIYHSFIRIHSYFLTSKLRFTPFNYGLLSLQASTENCY